MKHNLKILYVNWASGHLTKRMHILIIILRTAEGCATNALDKKKLLMIIRGFRPTSDIIDFTSVERCNQY